MQIILLQNKYFEKRKTADAHQIGVGSLLKVPKVYFKLWRRARVDHQVVIWNEYSDITGVW